MDRAHCGNSRLGRPTDAQIAAWRRHVLDDKGVQARASLATTVDWRWVGYETADE
jgi:hypothetical protein